MSESTFNVLFLCTGNSARSIMAEAMLNGLGRGRFRAFSAGSHPTGIVNPHAIETMQAAGMPTEGLRSKSWEEFAGDEAPPMHAIITVCDNAAGEACPVWPGKPVTAHWGVPDPAAVEGDPARRRRAFGLAATALRKRIELLTSLPMDKLDRLALQGRLRDIARS